MPAFTGLHPLQPESTTRGALEIYVGMDKALAAITGMKHFTFLPCAGAHGELTGLMLMREYHRAAATSPAPRSSFRTAPTAPTRHLRPSAASKSWSSSPGRTDSWTSRRSSRSSARTSPAS